MCLDHLQTSSAESGTSSISVDEGYECVSSGVLQEEKQKSPPHSPNIMGILRDLKKRGRSKL